MLVLENIHKSFGRVKVLQGISAEVKEGELVTFLGPSGCGKTTLLRIISGLTKPDSGKVILDGQVINDVTPDKRGIQMCFQNYALFPHLTVARNISYGLEVHKWKKERIKERVEELLHLVRLDGLGDRRIEELSGGQQQRVALARALALEPKVILLDEPLSNLDANLRVQMRATLRQIQRRVNISTIFVTHDQVEAMTISDRLVVMNRGRIEQVGTPVEIYEKPNNEFIASFIGYVNILEGEVKRIGKGTEPLVVSTQLGELEILSDEKELQVGKHVYLVIRPETIRICDQGEEGETNGFQGTIASVTYAGSTVKYGVDIDGKELTVDEYDPTTRGIRSMGDRVRISIPRNVHLLKG
ncbi:MAG: ABC transporter ATP-binding protein [Nitrospinota bacterium]|nr:MAG: ABC transporter ATP-binding protein [Nitrospinota bacterium]